MILEKNIAQALLEIKTEVRNNILEQLEKGATLHFSGYWVSVDTVTELFNSMQVFVERDSVVVNKSDVPALVPVKVLNVFEVILIESVRAVIKGDNVPKYTIPEIERLVT